jgi:hypothetical protein
MNEIQSIDFYFESNVIIYIGPSNKYTFRVGVGDILILLTVKGAAMIFCWGGPDKSQTDDR